MAKKKVDADVEKQQEAAVDGEVKETVKEETAEKEAEKEISREDMSDSEYIDALEERLGKALKEAEECKQIAQRIQADFDNYRKRNNSIAADMKQLGQSQVIEKLLAVLDNCDLARKYISDESALTGFNMMEAQILNALDSFGLKEIEADGKDFDAKLMNAVERVKDEEKAGKVVEVMMKGYTLCDKLLRPASVKVGYKE